MLQRLKHFVIAHYSQAQRCRFFSQEKVGSVLNFKEVCLKLQLTVKIKGKCLNFLNFFIKDDQQFVKKIININDPLNKDKSSNCLKFSHQDL